MRMVVVGGRVLPRLDLILRQRWARPIEEELGHERQVKD